MSRRLLACSRAAARKTDGHPHPEREPPVELVDVEVAGQRDEERSMLDVGRTRRGHEAEEDKDEELAETEVAVGPRTAGVAPSRDAADEADRHEPPRHAGGQAQARQRRHAEGDQCRDLHLPDRCQLSGHEPDRAHPLLVGAPDPVGVVVDVVRPDLNAEGHNQGQDRIEPRQLTVEACTDPRVAAARELRCEASAREVPRRGADDDRDDRRRQCAWARAGHPQLERRAHGRRGKREKSGSRCSTKAFRPSCPSSVM